MATQQRDDEGAIIIIRIIIITVLELKYVFAIKERRIFGLGEASESPGIP